MNVTDIKVAMANGMTKRQIMSMVDEAEAAYAEEARSRMALTEAREDLVDALVTYIEALGILPPGAEISDSDIETLTAMLKDAEEKLKHEVAMMAGLTKMTGLFEAPKVEVKMDKTEVDGEEAFRKFLESL